MNLPPIQSTSCSSCDIKLVALGAVATVAALAAAIAATSLVFPPLGIFMLGASFSVILAGGIIAAGSTIVALAALTAYFLLCDTKPLPPQAPPEPLPTTPRATPSPPIAPPCYTPIQRQDPLVKVIHFVRLHLSYCINRLDSAPEILESSKVFLKETIDNVQISFSNGTNGRSITFRFKNILDDNDILIQIDRDREGDGITIQQTKLTDYKGRQSLKDYLSLLYEGAKKISPNDWLNVFSSTGKYKDEYLLRLHINP